MSELREKLQAVFHQVFGDDDIVLQDTMTADDIDGWDSMMTINLMIAIEKKFAIKFATTEIAGIKAEGQNIGTLLALIQKKVGAKR